MLHELHISNLAVIEDAAITFDPTFNVFTGETGAGKSLIIGAFEVLLGLRTGGDMLRPGADEGRITGMFELHAPGLAAAVGEIVDQQLDANDQLLITRKLFASGRSSVSVNGHPATAAMVRQVGQWLVDIHGQHDHQYLLKPANQLMILDGFARTTARRDRFGELLGELRQLEQRREDLATSGTLRRQQLELYEFQADEIDQADPQPGEFPQLQGRHDVLSNVQRIKRDAGQAHGALYEAEGSVGERLQMITHLLVELGELDEDLADIAEQVRTATLTLQESAFELGRYIDRLDDEPGELAEVEDRLNTLNRLIQKYGDATGGAARRVNDDPAAAVLDYRREIGEQIDELRGQDEDMGQLDARAAKLREQLGEVGGALSQARRDAARRLKPLVEAQLKALGMAEATFGVTFETLEADDKDVGSTGLDRIELVVRINPGQEERPLRKTASGGELSRIMLAIKSILAGSDRVSVLVFDEIDANIGGRLGSVIGQKLRALSRRGGRESGQCDGEAENDEAESGRGHQILCITHLPQIAAFADNHLHIRKNVIGRGKQKQTRTTVTPLSGEARIEELAEMMAGQSATATTRRQAEELLEAAAA